MTDHALTRYIYSLKVRAQTGDLLSTEEHLILGAAIAQYEADNLPRNRRSGEIYRGKYDGIWYHHTGRPLNRRERRAAGVKNRPR